jgi:hypothetical protein
VSVREQLHQLPASDCLPHDYIGKPRDAYAVECQLQRGLTIVARNPRQDLRRLGALACMKWPGARWNGDNAYMVHEICRFARDTTPLKIRVELSFADRTQQHHLDGALRRWYLPTKRHKSGALRQRTLEQWLGVGITASLTSAIRLRTLKRRSVAITLSSSRYRVKSES